MVKYEEHLHATVRISTREISSRAPPPPRPGRAQGPGHLSSRADASVGGIACSGSLCPWPMRSVSWNICSLRDPRRRGVVGRYLKEWGTNIICLQETLLTCTD